MDTTRQTFSLPAPMLADLKEEAKARDMSLSQLIRECIRAGRFGDSQGSLDLRRESGNNDHGR